MIKHIISISLCLLPLCLLAQSNLVVNGVNLKVRPGTDFRVEQGNIRNDNNARIDNQANIYLDGNFNQLNSSTYNGGANSWLWFEGSSNQNASGDAPLNISRLRVDNGNILVLNSSVNVDLDVDLTNNGNIELGNNNLILASAANINNYDQNNYIITNGIGYLQQEVGAAPVFFPLGRSIYNPATLTNNGTTDNFQARVEDIVLDEYPLGNPEIDGVVSKAWFIEEQTVGGSDVTMTLQWHTTDELPNFNRTASGISHWTGSNWDRSPTWTNATNLGGGYWTQTRSNINSFSPFAVEDLEMDLPIELLDFLAVRLNPNQVQLDWQTVTELNNQGFEVQRMLENETEWTSIGWVDGNGTTSELQNYQYLDPNSFSGISYYRIRQFDFDGSFSFTPIRSVEGIDVAGDVSIFPNPTNEFVSVRFDGIKEQEVNIRIYAANGQLVLNKRSLINSNQVLELNEVQEFAAGGYLLQIIGTDLSFTKRFLKVRD